MAARSPLSHENALAGNGQPRVMRTRVAPFEIQAVQQFRDRVIPLRFAIGLTQCPMLSGEA